VRAGFVDLSDVRVTQAGKNLRLEDEASLSRLRPTPHGEYLDSHGSIGILLAGLVHCAHPAGGDHAGNSESSDGLTD